MNKTDRQIEDLLRNVKEHLSEIDALLEGFAEFEEDFIYRFYHQSFKVFYVSELLFSARDTFERLAPAGKSLNPWYLAITDEALDKRFSPGETNPNWLSEIRPLLEAFWHTKYFLTQMARFGRDLESCPPMLDSGWAAVLYLYNLR